MVSLMNEITDLSVTNQDNEGGYGEHVQAPVQNAKKD